MKRLTVFAIVLCLITAMGFSTLSAVTWVQSPEATNTMLSSVTTTGDGSAFDLTNTVSRFTCFVSTGGTAPTSVSVSLKGSVDGTNYVALATHTYTVASAATQMFHVVDKPVRYITASYNSKVGGSPTTSVSMVCTAGGN